MSEQTINNLKIVNEKMTTLCNKVRQKSGLTTSLSLDSIISAIDSIGENGTTNRYSEEGIGEYCVTLVDHDATVLKRIWANEGTTVVLPSKPIIDRSDEDLTFDGWCTSYPLTKLEDGSESFIMPANNVTVGALWGLTDGIIQIELANVTNKFALNIACLHNDTSTFMFDWGDGIQELISVDKFAINENEGVHYVGTHVAHDYTQPGNYKVRIYDNPNISDDNTDCLFLTQCCLSDENEIIYCGPFCGLDYDFRHLVRAIKIGRREQCFTFDNEMFPSCNNLRTLCIPNNSIYSNVSAVQFIYSSLQTLFIPNILNSENKPLDYLIIGSYEYLCFSDKNKYRGISIDESLVQNVDISNIPEFRIAGAPRLREINIHDVDKCNCAVGDTDTIKQIHVDNVTDLIITPMADVSKLKTINITGNCTSISWNPYQAYDIDTFIIPQSVSKIGANLISKYTPDDTSAYRNNLPKLKILDLTNLAIIPKIIIDNQSIPDKYFENLEVSTLSELTDRQWEPHPTMKLLVKESMLNEWKEHDIWSVFDDNIIGY